jgi:hypothetical protein
MLVSQGIPQLRARLIGEDMGAKIGQALVEGADAAIAWIGENYDTLFHSEVDDADRDKGDLRDSLWRSDAPTCTAANVTVEMGWGVIYGKVLEFGPEEKGPKKVTVKRAKAMRIHTPFGVVYRKSSTYVWKPSMLRPHFAKAIEATAPTLMAAIAKAMA